MELSGVHATNIQVQTSASAGAWVKFDPLPLGALSITNDTGTDLEYRRLAGGAAHPILDGTGHLVVGINSADQIELRRKDLATEQVLIKAVALD